MKVFIHPLTGNIFLIDGSLNQEIVHLYNFWDCDCKDNYIKHNRFSFCRDCKGVRDELPNSRLDEWLEQYGCGEMKVVPINESKSVCPKIVIQLIDGVGLDGIYNRLPMKCLIWDEPMAVVGLITKGCKGYYPMVGADKCYVDVFNLENGIDCSTKMAMVAGSLHGWDCDGINPGLYVNEGNQNEK